MRGRLALWARRHDVVDRDARTGDARQDRASKPVGRDGSGRARAFLRSVRCRDGRFRRFQTRDMADAPPVRLARCPRVGPDPSPSRARRTAPRSVSVISRRSGADRSEPLATKPGEDVHENRFRCRACGRRGSPTSRPSSRSPGGEHGQGPASSSPDSLTVFSRCSSLVTARPLPTCRLEREIHGFPTGRRAIDAP